MTTPTTDRFALGDVVFDSYANPAVVVRIDAAGQAVEIMQTCGSDRGRLTYPPVPRGATAPVRCTQATPAQIELARDIVRAECKRQGWKWDRLGITRR